MCPFPYSLTVSHLHLEHSMMSRLWDPENVKKQKVYGDCRSDSPPTDLEPLVSICFSWSSSSRMIEILVSQSHAVDIHSMGPLSSLDARMGPFRQVWMTSEHSVCNFIHQNPSSLSPGNGSSGFEASTRTFSTRCAPRPV